MATGMARDGGTIGAVGVPHTAPQLPLLQPFIHHLTISMGIAPVRRYLPDLVERILAGTFDPGPVFDRTLPLERVAEGYAAMADRSRSRSCSREHGARGHGDPAGAARRRTVAARAGAGRRGAVPRDRHGGGRGRRAALGRGPRGLRRPRRRVGGHRSRRPPVGYLLVDDVDGATHIEQVSVHPSVAGRGIGRALIETAVAHARARGHHRVTLTTFADVPWNAPYYRRLGFDVVPPDDQGPDLRRLRAHEASIGLDRWPRVAMARRLDG